MASNVYCIGLTAPQLRYYSERVAVYSIQLTTGLIGAQPTQDSSKQLYCHLHSESILHYTTPGCGRSFR
jgi:hypothetical protein